jgi:hypothetical protein
VSTPKWKKRKGQAHTHRKPKPPEQTTSKTGTAATTIVRPIVVSVQHERTTPEKKPHALIRGVRLLWALVVPIGVVVSLIVGYLALVPRLSIVPATEINSDNPLISPFTLENSGYLSIYSISFNAVIDKYEDSQGAKVEGPLSLFMITPDVTPELGAGRKTTIPISPSNAIGGFKPPYKKFFITIVAHFKPAFYWKTVERKFQFALITTSHGEQVWIPIEK